MHKISTTFCKLVASILLLFNSFSLHAQLKGDHILGDAGLQSGSQPPANTVTVLVPLYNYHASQFRNSDGDKIDAPDINMFVTGIGAAYVTDFKILGGTYGFNALIGFASNKIDGNLVYSKSPLAFSDIYFQPLQLGWKTKRADFLFGYALYLPTGKYELGGDDNSGLGMLSNEFSAGTTLYADQKKEFSFSTLLSYAIAGKKKNTGDLDITTGNILSIEGGFARSIYKPVKDFPIPMIVNVGLVYYMQFKTTDDKLSGYNAFYGSSDHLFALGAEANMLIPKPMLSFGARWLGELGTINRFQGNTFFITLAKIIPTGTKKK